MVKPEGFRESIFKAEELDRPKVIPMIVEIDRKTILHALRADGIDVPSDARVTFKVPGGGDYSNCEVDLDNDQQIITVRYEK